MPRLFVSTVGTSLLTNVARDNGPEISRLLRDTANWRENELDRGRKEAIDNLVFKAEEVFRQAPIDEAHRLSAELNGLLRYYGPGLQDRPSTRDIHFLISTDTFQGQRVAGIVKQYLKGRGLQVMEPFVPQGLSTRDSRSFASGIKQVIKWCKETLSEFRKSGYHVVFNLVGGFKSLQGIMNTLGMFYADEIIYIFEAETADLIRIPRLPIRMDIQPVLQKKAKTFLLMENGYIIKKDEVQDIPEIYLDCDEAGFCTLSEWGLLVWEENKRSVLGESPLLDFEGLIYEKSFAKDFERLEKTRRSDVLATLAQVALLFKENGLAGLREHPGLRYTNYQGFGDKEIGHFRLNQDWRVSCLAEGRVLSLRHVGPHDYVNNNP
ncbi:MAG: putative CRISPR-associated protein [Bacillota bacterium]